MGKLILIGVPLGNIEDISIRAMKKLFDLDILLTEDTRNFLKLKSILKERFEGVLNEFQIEIKETKLISYREQNHNEIVYRILKLLEEGREIGLITDAGMPSISDPGQRLVEEVLNAGHEVDVIPGPTAVDTALAVSGLPSERFTFISFLPRERGKILRILEDFKDREETLIFYESPFRLKKSLEVIAGFDPKVKVVACNDLTKRFQRVIRGIAEEVLQELKAMKELRGEWVVVMRK